MARSRLILILVIAAIVAAGLTVVAIRTTSTPDVTSTPTVTPQASMSPLPAPSPTVDPVIAWADAVCTAATPARDTITGVGADLDVQLGPDALAQIQQRLAARADLLSTQLTPITIALGAVPVDVPEAIALAERLGPQVQALQSRGTTAKTAIDTLTASGDVISFGLALPEAVTAVRAAADAAGVVIETVREAAGDEGSRLGAGFQASAVCRDLIGSSPSTAAG